MDAFTVHEVRVQYNNRFCLCCGSVILNKDPAPGGQLFTDPNPDRSWTFLWSLKIKEYYKIMKFFVKFL